ncbi:SDR family oxidoreductase [Paenibacillus sp. HWE-109]|uniref:SDR family NAD(P)-dependent oxidoreductase n=1 Tax=Paenibacillus sp. HWE-109 TaxID=1306526 RepID=UPI001EDE0D58|nr:SDR family oxidoreductase [Paenibacillus sp. HWE-109]UKS24503.1 SDR family oxidoreductase [Paenibacillus sp. HWE-109]
MDTGLKGKKVLVTGSTTGIGKGIVEAFAQEGADVILNGSVEERVNKAVIDLQAKYKDVKISGIAANLAIPEEADRLYDEASEDGQLDLLVNNLGIFPVKPFAEITDDDWYHIWNVNVMSTVRLCRRALPDMLRANSGKIININSEAGFRPNGDLVHYSTTKSALLGLSRAMAELTKGSKVTVNSVLPVTTWTPGIETYLQGYAERGGISLEQAKINYFKEGNDSTSLLQRFLTVEEVAKTVIFAACNDGVNGNSILIDAGVIRHI